MSKHKYLYLAFLFSIIYALEDDSIHQKMPPQKPPPKTTDETTLLSTDTTTVQSSPTENQSEDTVSSYETTTQGDWITNNTEIEVIHFEDNPENGDTFNVNTTGEYNWLFITGYHLGYGVNVIVQSLNINMEDGDSFMIAPGEEMSESTLMITAVTGPLTNPIKFRLPNIDVFRIKVFIGMDGENKSFTITTQQYGEPTTTVPPTTPDVKPPVDIATNAEIFVTGKTPTEFIDLEFFNEFLTAFRNLSWDYCNDKGIQYEQKPVNETVFVDRISECSLEWPNRDSCVELLISSYVAGDNDPLERGSPHNYELTPEHILDMWFNYSDDSTYFKSLGISRYKVDTQKIIFWWGMAGLLLLLLMCILFLSLWKYLQILEKDRFVRNGEGNEENNEKPRESVFWQPTKHQVIPEFMYSEAEDSIQYPPDTFELRKHSKRPLKSALRTTTDSPSFPVNPARISSSGLPVVSFAGAYMFKARDNEGYEDDNEGISSSSEEITSDKIN